MERESLSHAPNAKCKEEQAELLLPFTQTSVHSHGAFGRGTSMLRWLCQGTVASARWGAGGVTLVCSRLHSKGRFSRVETSGVNGSNSVTGGISQVLGSRSKGTF